MARNGSRVTGGGSLRVPAVKGAALRLASLGPDGPPLTASPLRLGGNDGPLARTYLDRRAKLYAVCARR